MNPGDRDQPTSGAARLSIVLGGGWKLGGAFHAGVLLALQESWGVDARSADEVIGTSSGAITAGLLAAGMSPRDLFGRETGTALSAEGRALFDRLGRHGLQNDGDSAKGRSGHPVPSATEQRGPRGPRTVGLTPRGVVTALLPRGTGSMARLEDYFDCLIGSDWPSAMDLRLCAVDLGTGGRVALDSGSGASVGQAIAASCAVPGVSKPVPIRDREYVDGAVYSVNNADVAVTRRQATERSAGPAGEHIVIVSAPLSINRLQLALGPQALFRNAMHLQTAAELRKLDGVDRLIVIEPTSHDAAVMGPNMNAGHRRARVAKCAFATAFDRFSRLDPADRLSA